MRKYARIQDGVVVETLDWDGWIYDLMPEHLNWVEITGMDPLPDQQWLYDGSIFSPPPPIVIDPRPGIIAELEQIDRDSAAPLRILVVADPMIGQGTEERIALEALEARASVLRAQLELIDG
ncbi:hypothetical protein D3C81_1760700 [compost metagenome]